MILTPSAKPIRIRIVSGGEEHSSIQSLRANYLLSDIIRLVADGRLYKWLVQKGEAQSASIAETLMKKELKTDSPELLALTCSIFGISPDEGFGIKQFLIHCKDRYPKSYLNNLIEWKDLIDDIRDAIDIRKNNPTVFSDKEWEAIFTRILKSLPLDTALSYLTDPKSPVSISNKSRLMVFRHFSDTASPEELFKIGQELLNMGNARFATEANLLIQRSAGNGYAPAEKWIADNCEAKYFDEFLEAPSKFRVNYDPESKSELIRFLCVLSKAYAQYTKSTKIEIENAGTFEKYLLVVNAFWELARRESVFTCIETLKAIPCKFHDYSAPEKFAQAIRDEKSREGRNMRGLSYGELIKFVARHVKSELGYGE